MNPIYIYIHEDLRLEISFLKDYNCLSIIKQYHSKIVKHYKLTTQDMWYDIDDPTDIEYSVLPELIEQLQRVEKLLVLQ
jgi:hypothetical protein